MIRSSSRIKFNSLHRFCSCSWTITITIMMAIIIIIKIGCSHQHTGVCFDWIYAWSNRESYEDFNLSIIVLTLALKRYSTPLLVLLTCSLCRSIHWLVSQIAPEKAGSSIARGWSVAFLPSLNCVIRGIQWGALDDCNKKERKKPWSTMNNISIHRLIMDILRWALL